MDWFSPVYQWLIEFHALGKSLTPNQLCSFPCFNRRLPLSIDTLHHESWWYHTWLGSYPCILARDIKIPCTQSELSLSHGLGAGFACPFFVSATEACGHCGPEGIGYDPMKHQLHLWKSIKKGLTWAWASQRRVVLRECSGLSDVWIV